jgi:hypothetical protein
LAKNNSLEEEKSRMEQAVKESKLLASQKIRVAEQKTKRLHKIILDSGLSQSAPIDEEIEVAFSQLKHRISQLVKKHCTKHDGSRRKFYDQLPAEYKDLWAMAMIADQLWDEYFAPEARLFGFDAVADGHLGKFETALGNDTRGTTVC